jgi:hypothetical protein
MVRPRTRVPARALLVGAYAVVLTITLVAVVARTGEIVFVLDDPYIHLAIARNLSNHLTFGVTPGAYESASSSPIWTLLLAVGLTATPLTGTALVLGLGIAGSVWVLWNLLPDDFLERVDGGPLLVAAVAALPITIGLVPLTLAGMEHTLHAAIVLQILVILPRLVDGTATSRHRVAYYALLATSGLVRFESVFLAIGCAIALVVTAAPPQSSSPRWHRWRAPTATMAAVVTPLLAFGLVNRAAGQYLVPNSVAAKSALGGGSLLPSWSTVIERVGRDRLLGLLVVLLVAALVVSIVRRWRGLEAALIALLATAALHVVFANVGWFDRYQAYLVISGVALLLRVAARMAPPERRTAGWAVALVLLALTIPRLQLLTTVPDGARNIHDQQEQMAQFFAQEYPGVPIAVNDLGYVAWLHDGPVVDLAGLGSFEVLEATKEHRADPAFFAELARRHGVQAVAVYQDLFGGIIPARWIPVETWCIDEPLVTAADDCVTFYGTDKEAALHLRSALDDYVDQLPDSVERRYVMVGLD